MHSRFCTNTFPSWPLAHPYRMLAHNGEINTVQGNENWMRAREASWAATCCPALERAFPICTPGASDTARFDEALELLHLGGRPLHHAMLMMIPEAWENHESMDAAQAAFYRYHASLMEPWDGPASIAFTDGTVIGAVLDRNGLRPSRYWVTDDDLVIMASRGRRARRRAREDRAEGPARAGQGSSSSTPTQGRIIPDDEIKAELAALHPYQEWLDAGLVHLDDLPPQFPLVPQHSSAVQQQRMFGYTQEDLRILIAPMARNAVESLGSMGTDTPVPVISDRPRMLYDYFKQLFAQVTNPPLDANFEALVTSLASTIGPEGNLLAPGPDVVPPGRAARPDPHQRRPREAALHRRRRDGVPGFTAVRRRRHYPVADGGDGLRMAIDDVRAKVSDGDRGRREDHHPLRPLRGRRERADPGAARSRRRCTTTSSARRRARRSASSSRPARRARCTTSRCCSATAPARSTRTSRSRPSSDLCRRRRASSGLTERKAVKNYVKAAGKGMLKVMSKMGISTVASYTGAQIFEAVGLEQELVDEYFTGTASRIQGIGLDVIAEEVAARHADRVSRPARGARAPRARRSVASTSGGAKGSTTSSTRTPSSSCSTPPAPVGTRSSSSTRSSWTTRPRGSRRCAACSS